MNDDARRENRGKIDRRSLIGASGAITLGSLGGSVAAESATVAGNASAPARLSRQVSGSVTMWVYPLIGVGTEDQDLWDSIIEEFNAEQPDVDVTVEIQPWDRRVEKLTTAMAVGHGPDVWYINFEDVPNHAEAGRLLPLDDMLSDEVKGDYLPNAIAGLSYNDSLCAAPILLLMSGTGYNTALFEEAGITTDLVTWDELREAAPTFKEHGSYLFWFATTAPQDRFYQFIWQAGGEIYSEDGQTVVFNSPEGVEALTFITELFEAEYIPQSSATAEGVPITETPLGRGEVAISTEGSSALKQLSDTWGEGVLKIGPPLKYKEQVAQGNGAGLAISSEAESPEAAAAWINHVITPETLTKINQATGYFPPRVSVGSIHEGDPILGELEKYLPMVHPVPAHLLGREISSDVLRPELEAALLGQKSPQQALDDAAARANELIAQQ